MSNKKEVKGYSWENRRKYLRYTLLLSSGIICLLTVNLIYLGYTDGSDKAIDSQLSLVQTFIAGVLGLLISYFGFSSYENKKQ